MKSFWRWRGRLPLPDLGKPAPQFTATKFVKLAAICCIFLWMPTAFTRAAEDSIEKLVQDPRCARALDWIERNTTWLTTQQIRISEIPAPEFNEAARGEYVKKLFESAGLKAHTDKLGNVVAERPGTETHSVVLFVAHLDTVFPAGTDLKVKREGSRIVGPGISDNAAGLAALVGLAKALEASHIRTAKTIVLAASVGEEGEGNLRGVRALIDTYKSRLAAVIAVDGASTDHVTIQAIASRRFEITVTGPGGHSWSDFGAPNAITALSRGIVKFSAIRLPDDPRTSYNFGVIEGGTSVNSIPARASVKVDLRSEDEAALDRIEAQLRDAMQAGAKEEMSAGQPSRSSGVQVEVSFKLLGSRPAGKISEDAPLLETIRGVEQYLGNKSRYEHSSTDANIPLSMGIPAVAVGGGGRGSGSHTLAEWYDPTGRELGLKRLLLISLSVAGVQP